MWASCFSFHLVVKVNFTMRAVSERFTVYHRPEPPRMNRLRRSISSVAFPDRKRTLPTRVFLAERFGEVLPHSNHSNCCISVWEVGEQKHNGFYTQPYCYSEKQTSHGQTVSAVLPCLLSSKSIIFNSVGQRNHQRSRMAKRENWWLQLEQPAGKRCSSSPCFFTQETWWVMRVPQNL